MLSRRLRSYEAFADLGPAELDTVAASARVVRLPARRWLVRPGRDIAGWYFLQRGRVRLYQPDAIVDATSARARRPLFPGARGVLTDSAAEFVRLDGDVLAQLHGADGDSLPPLYQVQAGIGWEHRFLDTAVMRTMVPAQWQRVLRAMRRVYLVSGEPVIRRGETGEEFFVVRSGTAEVQVRGSRVALLRSGDFFGEDALITGTDRNANVVMAAPGSVMVLPAARFLAEVMPSVRDRVAADPRVMTSLDVSAGGSTADVCVPVAELRDRVRELDPSSGYRIVGGSIGERELAAFILMHRGIRSSVDYR